MSRSNPQTGHRNPATRWHEWQGELGALRYWDRDAKVNKTVALPFTFLLLDQLATVKGWHEASQSGIFANEVRDTRQTRFIVKAFKGGTLAEGFYKEIKDRVANLGGHYVANCYVAFRPDGSDELAIGSVQWKGAALRAWMEFSQAHRSEIYQKAIQVKGFTEGKKGRIIYRVPTFALMPVSEATQTIALALDAELQKFLTGYLAAPTTEQAARPAHPDEDAIEEPPPPDDRDAARITDEDIPF